MAQRSPSSSQRPDPIQVEHERINQIIHELEALLRMHGGLQYQRSSGDVVALTGFLSTHFAREEETIYRELSGRNPSLRRAVAAFKAEHCSLMDALVEVSQSLQAHRWDDAASQLRCTLQRLAAHEQAEREVLQKADAETCEKPKAC